MTYLLTSKVAAIYNNLGNLETASGNLTDSRDYFDRAILIWMSGGDTTATHLALTYLSMGRMHMLRGQLDQAQTMIKKAEALFVRTGESALAMAQ
jgi:tetratricopeptide (TPR) repeat protein